MLLSASYGLVLVVELVGMQEPKDQGEIPTSDCAYTYVASNKYGHDVHIDYPYPHGVLRTS
jgi:hypothetical protein